MSWKCQIWSLAIMENQLLSHRCFPRRSSLRLNHPPNPCGFGSHSEQFSGLLLTVAGYHDGLNANVQDDLVFPYIPCKDVSNDWHNREIYLLSLGGLWLGSISAPGWSTVHGIELAQLLTYNLPQKYPCLLVAGQLCQCYIFNDRLDSTLSSSRTYPAGDCASKMEKNFFCTDSARWMYTGTILDPLLHFSAFAAW